MYKLTFAFFSLFLFSTIAGAQNPITVRNNDGRYQLLEVRSGTYLYIYKIDSLTGETWVTFPGLNGFVPVDASDNKESEPEPPVTFPKFSQEKLNRVNEAYKNE